MVLESQTGEFVLLNLWVGSQSHRQGVCVQQIQDRRVRGVGAAHSCVNKFYMR